MTTYRVYNIEVPLGAGDKALYRAVLKRLHLDANKVQSITLTKRAIDARRHQVRLNCTADVAVKPKFETEIAEQLKDFRNLDLAPQTPAFEFPTGGEAPAGRIVVIGSGPAGLLAAWVLAKHGYRPLLVERGAPAEDRLRSIGRFNNAGGELDSEANALFGEGGAGTFSDGKLYTRKNRDPYLMTLLELFVAHGAPQEILIDAAPHVGTDKLAPVVVSLRQAAEAAGAEVRFHTRLESVEIEGGALRAVTVAGPGGARERVETGACVLGIGHSARDTFQMLRDAGVSMEARPFQFGVRIEHPQRMVDEAQFGRHAGDPELGAAEYFLTCSQHPELGEIHSFCMCPGGIVIPAVAEDGGLNTNGMSFSLRHTGWANAGLVTTLDPADFGGASNPLAGIEFQRHYERLAFQAGGGGFVCPVQSATDFLTGLVTKKELDGSYPRGRRYADLAPLLPEQLVKALRYALPRFERSIPGFAGPLGVLHAVEARASSPVRILRDEETRQSLSATGLYPVGEGAGYAGGIVSAALDGVRSAAALMARHAPAR